MLVVKAREPFLAWLRSLPGMSDVTLDAVNDDTTVYLVPECDDDSKVDEILEENYAAIFEEQVNAWSRDPDDWPDVYDFQTFREWFHVESHSLIMDLGNRPIETDEMQ